MSDETGITPTGRAAGEATSYLHDEYQQWAALLDAQPTMVQQFIQAQARQLADGLTQNVSQARFALPNLVVPEAGKTAVPVPAEFREQLVGGVLSRLDLQAVLRQRLSKLEGAPEQGVALSAGLLRYSTAVYMVYDLLPAGRSVTYAAAEGEEIPTLPVSGALEPESAITALTDAIAEEGQGSHVHGEEGRGELLVPYVPAARRFFLPQWVAFNDANQLLVNTVGEAEAYLASMQQFMKILHTAVALAPYIIADESYQQKRYGMMGQLINQGRALGRYQTHEIIEGIKQRAEAQDLNRGLSLSLPYFDDQVLMMKLHNFEVIPAGRIMFIPAFVVRAAQLEQARVGQDTRLSPSTRNHLLIELKMLEEAFKSGSLPEKSARIRTVDTSLR
jgi:hypothetical protein